MGPILEELKGYALNITDGVVVAGKHEIAACQRFLDDCAREDLLFSEKLAQRMFGFFENNLVIDQADGSVGLMRLLDWQKFILGQIAGWHYKDQKDASGFPLRRFQTLYLETGKGSGKTPLLAGLGLYLLIRDRDHSADVCITSGTLDQAKILFGYAIKMSTQSPALLQMKKQKLLVQHGDKNPEMLTCAETRKFRIFSGEAKNKSGHKPSAVICDELHEVPSGYVIDMLKAGFKSRLRPLLVLVTNTPENSHGYCGIQRQIAIEAMKRPTHDNFLTFIACCDKDDDPLEDERCWRKANPSLGQILPKSYLRQQVQDAIDIPANRSRVLRINFGIMAGRSEGWIDLRHIETAMQDFDIAALEGEKIVLGVDMSQSKDLTVIAAICPSHKRAWVYPFMLTKQIPILSKQDNAPYEEWHRQGFLHGLPGNVILQEDICSFIFDLAERFIIDGVFYDPYNFARSARELRKLDCDVVAFPQTFVPRRTSRSDEEKYYDYCGLSMPASVNILEEKILSGDLALHHNPLLRMGFAQVIMEHNATGGRKPDKDKRATHRIDTIVSLVMAAGVYQRSRLPGILEYLEAYGT